MSGEIVRYERPRAMSVEEAKENLLAWGDEAQAAHEAALEKARLAAKKATPFAALAAGLMGVSSIARLFGGSRKRKRRDERDEDERGEERNGRRHPLIAILPLVVAGAKLAPVVLDAFLATKRRGG